MKKLCLFIAVFILFVLSCDNLYNKVAEEKKDMQRLVFINANGESVDLTSGNYGITEWSGFSNTELNLQTQQVPFHDGSVYLDGLLSERELSVTLAMNDENNLEKRYQLRRELISILNPKLGEGTLIYTNDYTSKQIKCVPEIPLFENHNSNDSGTPKASLAWTACNPYWEDVEETEVNIKIGQTATVNNTGDLPIPVKIELFGQGETNPSIENITTKQKIEYNGVLDNTLFINTNYGEKSCYTTKLNFNKVSYFSATFYNMCYSDKENKFICVGDRGVGLISNDFENFQYVKINNNNIRCIIYAKDKDMFIVGGWGGIYTSPDGITWTERLDINIPILKIAYNETDSIFVAVGETSTANSIYRSTDGITWTEINNTVYLRGVTYSEEKSLFVAVGLNTIITSTDGITWTERYSEDNTIFNSVTYSAEKSLFVAVGDYGKICTSSNGTSWSVLTFMNIYNYRDIIYANDYFIAVGEFTSIDEVIPIVKSKDGINWQDESLDVIDNQIYDLYGILYINEINNYIICGSHGVVLKSDNLKDWTAIKNYQLSGTIQSICFSERQKKYVAVGSKVIFYSENGYDWNTVEAEEDYNFRTICYCDKLNIYVAGGYHGTAISYDGVNWNNRTNIPLRKIIYAEDKELFVGISGGTQIYTSPDGITWTERYNNNTLPMLFYDIAYSAEKSLFVAVSGDINCRKITSTDGITWTLQNSGRLLNCIIYNDEDGVFVTGGENAIEISEDGFNWNSINLGYSSLKVLKLNYARETNTYLALLDNDIVISSIDAVNWQYAGTVISGADIIYSDELNEYIICGVVGYFGAISNVDYRYNENQISKLTPDSDMQFQLKKGTNKLRLLHKSNAVFSARVTYRQKYIGV